jgi:hypothetical protein
MTAVAEQPRFRFSLQAVQAQSKREWLELVRAPTMPAST